MTLIPYVHLNYAFNLLKSYCVQILMELEDWSEALAYCRLTIPVYQSMSCFFFSIRKNVLFLFYSTFEIFNSFKFFP